MNPNPAKSSCCSRAKLVCLSLLAIIAIAAVAAPVRSSFQARVIQATNSLAAELDAVGDAILKEANPIPAADARVTFRTRTANLPNSD